jgi:hypothetical protein
MSGGSYDYVYQRIADIEINNEHECPKRGAFQMIISLVAQAMHDIEWVDSGDYGKGGEDKALDNLFAVLGKDPKIVEKALAYDKLKEHLTQYFKEN